MDKQVLNTSAALAAAIMTQHAERAIPVRTALWANERRRTGINPRTGKEYVDAQLTGTVEIDVLAIGPMLAEAIQNGDVKLTLFADGWQNLDADGKPLVNASGAPLPLITIKARNVRVGKTDAAGKPDGHADDVSVTSEPAAASQSVG
jgi:hypothetical protein